MSALGQKQTFAGLPRRSPKAKASGYEDIRIIQITERIVIGWRWPVDSASAYHGD